ncbi:hypothetical protein MMC09_004526 [Bachmanniomyces sp. S44760]|nr:hypothetical protein [Bachmanniomyces sp. S44760]
MKFSSFITYLPVCAAVVGAQTVDGTQATFPVANGFKCPPAGGNFCISGSLQGPSIIRCKGTKGSPGDCNTDLQGLPPIGPKTDALCYQFSSTSGSAACSLHGTVYPDSGLPFPVLVPNLEARDAPAGIEIEAIVDPQTEQPSGQPNVEIIPVSVSNNLLAPPGVFPPSPGSTGTASNPTYPMVPSGVFPPSPGSTGTGSPQVIPPGVFPPSPGSTGTASNPTYPMAPSGVFPPSPGSTGTGSNPVNPIAPPGVFPPSPGSTGTGSVSSSGSGGSGGCNCPPPPSCPGSGGSGPNEGPQSPGPQGTNAPMPFSTGAPAGGGAPFPMNNGTGVIGATGSGTGTAGPTASAGTTLGTMAHPPGPTAAPFKSAGERMLRLRISEVGAVEMLLGVGLLVFAML